MAPHSSTLAWKIPWTEEPGGLQFMGLLRVGHDWVTSLSRIGEENGNPLQCSCLENPRDRGAWWAAVYGVAQSWTWLKRQQQQQQQGGQHRMQWASCGDRGRGQRGGRGPVTPLWFWRWWGAAGEFWAQEWQDLTEILKGSLCVFRINRREKKGDAGKPVFLVFRKANSNCYSTSIKCLHMNRITHTIRIIWP